MLASVGVEKNGELKKLKIHLTNDIFPFLTVAKKEKPDIH